MRDKAEHEILVLAESEPSSWSAAVVRKEQACWILMAPMPLQSRLRLSYAMSCIHSGSSGHARAREQTTWHSSARNLEHWQSYSGSHWTVHQLAMFGIGIRDAQAWSQLKLQGYFSHTASGPIATCRFCAKECLEVLEHLLM